MTGDEALMIAIVLFVIYCLWTAWDERKRD